MQTRKVTISCGACGWRLETTVMHLPRTTITNEHGETVELVNGLDSKLCPHCLALLDVVIEE